MPVPVHHDLINHLVPLEDGMPLKAIRDQRAKVVHATQNSCDALFAPALPDLPLDERLLVARLIAQLSGSAVLEAHYHQAWRAMESAPANEPRLAEVLYFARTLTEHPVAGDRAALQRLCDAGLTTPAVVALAQLIGFVTYQVRVVAGLQAMAALGDADTAAPSDDAPAAPFVHPANLPRAGVPLTANGYTSQSLGWRAWLPAIDLNHATPAQLAVLDASHPQARASDYYLLLAHQPHILSERSAVFNAVMYAPGGLSRAERELASTVVSRVNGCVYCASVHALRFEQLAKRNDVIAQVFTNPQDAGTTPRERAIVQTAVVLTQSPADFDAARIQALYNMGCSTLEVLDLIHSIALFGWANRLMLNLGEPVFPQAT